jgi:nucleoside-diphosphate-sugar epimerase
LFIIKTINNMENKRILITGITGFIGSQLKEKIEGEKYGLVKFWDLPMKHEGYVPIYGDLKDYHSLAKLIQEIKPEIVIHLAALTSVSQSFDRPQEYFEVNTVGTINLAEINLKYNPYLKKFIFAGTPEEYGIQEKFPIKEDAPLNPNSPYAVSKVAATKYLLYMFHTYNFPVVISRHANCYGRKFGEFQKLGVLENIVTQMIKGKDVYLGEPDVRRDFLYIDDILDWYSLLLEKGKNGEIYNAGWGKSYSIRECAELAKEILGFKGSIFWHSIPKRPGEIPKIELDASKARQKLGWKPKINLREGLKLLAEYWRKRIGE